MPNWTDYTNVVRDPNRIETSIAGVAYEGRAAVARQLQVGEQLLLDRDVGNPHDPNAVAVVRVMDGKQVGFLPRDVAARIAAVVDQVDVSLKVVVTDLIDMDRMDISPAVFVSFELPTFDLP